MKLYHSVIEDVIAGVRDSFLDEGVDEQVLQELKQIWETKLLSSKALELNPEPPEPQPPQIGNQKDGRSNLSGKSGLSLNLYLYWMFEEQLNLSCSVLYNLKGLNNVKSQN